ncbi:hypothetical protein RJT34_29912 [Clitoria ternatea]|uniref:Uncharacterized protein n=1 Tax=Clitoria ternatea TaxID=43366 RepID=A0AAN9I264_CLITE
MHASRVLHMIEFCGKGVDTIVVKLSEWIKGCEIVASLYELFSMTVLCYLLQYFTDFMMLLISLFLYLLIELNELN